MNISELNQALHAIADEVTDDSRTRLASVDRRVDVTRRSKVAATLVTTCAVVAGVIFLPNWGLLQRSGSTAPATKPAFGSLDTVRNGDFLIYKDAGGVRLLKSRLAPAGTRAVDVTVTPRSGNLGWTQPCPSTATAGLEYHLQVNHKDIPSAALESLRYTGVGELSRPNTTCDQATSPMQVERSLSVSPNGNTAAWRRLGVEPGHRAHFRLSVTAGPDAPPNALAQARPMLAIFEIPRHPVQTHGIWIDRYIVDPPAAEGAFKLVHRKFVNVGPGRTQLSVPVPDNGKQLYVRTYVKQGEKSGASLTQGAPTRNELDTAAGPWHVEKSISAGPSMVQTAVISVPEGEQRQVVMLVYARYQ